MTDTAVRPPPTRRPGAPAEERRHPGVWMGALPSTGTPASERLSPVRVARPLLLLTEPGADRTNLHTLPDLHFAAQDQRAALLIIDRRGFTTRVSRLK